MSLIAEKILAYMQNEYKNRIANNPNMTDDSACRFNPNKLSETLRLSENAVDEATSELKNYGYVSKWVTGTVILVKD